MLWQTSADKNAAVDLVNAVDLAYLNISVLLSYVYFKPYKGTSFLYNSAELETFLSACSHLLLTSELQRQTNFA